MLCLFWKKSNTSIYSILYIKMARCNQDFDILRKLFAANLLNWSPLDFFLFLRSDKEQEPVGGGMHIYYTTALPTSLWHSPHICSRCTHPWKRQKVTWVSSTPVNFAQFLVCLFTCADIKRMPLNFMNVCRRHILNKILIIFLVSRWFHDNVVDKLCIYIVDKMWKSE